MYEDSPSYAVIENFVDELVHAGVRYACISPGARSTPLVLTMANHPELRAWSHVDERSGSFFALGVAKATCSPVAIVCTSGTAAANFFPAIIEAAYAHVPLVVLTADRPPELRECGAWQAIDQLKLYGGHVKWFAEVGTADAGWRYFRTLACRAVATACATPPGPVHLNFPFREPLMPTVPSARRAEIDDVDPVVRPYTRTHDAQLLPPESALDELATRLANTPHGLIACGPYDASRSCTAAVIRLANLAGYPILADPTSQLRSSGHDTSLVVDSYDVILRDPNFTEQLVPDLLVRVGAMPTSKAFANYLQRHPECRQLVLDPFGPWNDPLHMAAEMLRCDPQATCEAIADRLEQLNLRQADPTWRTTWIDAGQRARHALTHQLHRRPELFEGRVFTELAELLPTGTTLYVGNSLSVRELEAFWPAGPRAVRMLCNRGASGIDGFVSSGLGAAAVSDGPVVVVTGDLGFYHDLNGLLAARRYGLRATIIVLNNDGGGIFSYLPQAECGAPFKEYFLTPHGLDFRGAVEMYACSFTRVASWQEFRATLDDALHGPSTTVIEVPVNHAQSVALHRELWALGAQAAATSGV